MVKVVLFHPRAFFQMVVIVIKSILRICHIVKPIITCPFSTRFQNLYRFLKHQLRSKKQIQEMMSFRLNQKFWNPKLSLRESLKVNMILAWILNFLIKDWRELGKWSRNCKVNKRSYLKVNMPESWQRSSKTSIIKKSSSKKLKTIRKWTKSSRSKSNLRSLSKLNNSTSKSKSSLTSNSLEKANLTNSSNKCLKVSTSCRSTLLQAPAEWPIQPVWISILLKVSFIKILKKLSRK